MASVGFIDAIAVAVYVPGPGAEDADLIRSTRAAPVGDHRKVAGLAIDVGAAR